MNVKDCINKNWKLSKNLGNIHYTFPSWQKLSHSTETNNKLAGQTITCSSGRNDKLTGHIELNDKLSEHIMTCSSETNGKPSDHFMT